MKEVNSYVNHPSILIWYHAYSTLIIQKTYSIVSCTQYFFHYSTNINTVDQHAVTIVNDKGLYIVHFE